MVLSDNHPDLLERRAFITGGAALLCMAGWPPGARGAAEASPVRDEQLPLVPVDMDASRARQTLVLAGGRQAEDYPAGCRITLPAGAALPIRKWTWRPARQAGAARDVRLVIEGMPGGPRPRLVSVGEGEMLRVMTAKERVSAIGFRNLEIIGNPREDSFRPNGLSFLEMDRVRMVGGRNCMLLPSFPTLVRFRDCEFMHGGTGNGYSHSIYLNHIKRLEARNCVFHSARQPGHAFKGYAAETVLEGCAFYSWRTKKDLADGYGGELPLLDIGAWGHSLITGCRFWRRAPARAVCIDVRNRQWRKGYARYVPEDWGTQVVVPELIDNRDLSNRHLFHHLIVGNIFANGVLPDGSLDPGIQANPGAALRHNGTKPWQSGGKVEEAWMEERGNWLPHQERSIVWMGNNRNEGVPFEAWALDHPFRKPGTKTPVRDIAALPAEGTGGPGFLGRENWRPL